MPENALLYSIETGEDSVRHFSVPSGTAVKLRADRDDLYDVEVDSDTLIETHAPRSKSRPLP